ncbi:MAG: hypothetical protein HYX69_02000 [Planctomycetia bacterium]|nr:hypothetical protein [Planctomycetia bacterium]
MIPAFTVLVLLAVAAALCAAGVVTWKVVRSLPALRAIGTYRDFVFEPIPADRLDAATRRYFDRDTASLLALGFEPIGDYLLLPAPAEVYARFFISADRHSFAAAEDWNVPLLRNRACCFSSVCEDGMYLETGSQRPAPIPPDAGDRLSFTGLPGEGVERIYEHHRATVDAYAAEHATSVIAFAPEQFRDVATYGHRLVGHSLYRQGFRNEPPPTVEVLSPQAEELVTR